MKIKEEFDILIKSDKNIEDKFVADNLADLLFKKLLHRDENCDIIWSHYNDDFIKISLKRLRYISASLYKEFKSRGIKPGDSVILADLMVNNVSLISIFFVALVSYGCRVMLPMWVETNEISNWIKMINCKCIFAPEEEINRLKGYRREKQIIDIIKNTAVENGIPFYDIERDFGTKKYLFDLIPENFSPLEDEVVKEVLNDTNADMEMAIFTTSGTTGRSKLLVYTQKAYLNTIAAYEASNLYNKGMGGRNFIDIFTHTVSVRSLVNSLWTGQPVCMLTSSWIKDMPEKILPLLMKMKIEVATLGPSSFSFIIEFVKTFPELKERVFSDLKTVVSTGAPYSIKTAEEYKKILGLTLHNAYGLVETQQVLTTLLDEKPFNPFNPNMGKPIAGVEIGLKKFSRDTYKLFIKTCFGHKYMIDPKEGLIYPDEFLDSGDIVKVDRDKNIYYIGRENSDFFKNGFGAKVPLAIMKEYYRRLYEKVKHIEYYAPEDSTISLGVAALIFIENKELPSGRVTDKREIKRYTRIIKNINNFLYKTIEPFEYDQRAITRFLLINHEIPRTRKNTISKYRIEVEFKGEIDDLKLRSHGDGVVSILKPRQKLLNLILKLSHIKFLNKFILKMIIKDIE
ncbi:MAG TPA: hypothetical protein ENI44_01805 [Thermoplasmatales archaeon]|nr:hypothetical protein [Thermoplasmatales archaeon]